MKKILLIATIGVAGLVSAKGLDETKLKKDEVKTEKSQEAEAVLRQLCSQISIPVWCTGQSLDNTYCWEEGNQASFEEALHCYETDYEMFNNELCN